MSKEDIVIITGINFIDADDAIILAEDITRLCTLIQDCRYFLHSYSYRTHNYKSIFELEEIKSIVHWVRSNDVRLSIDQANIIQVLEHELVNDSIGHDVQLPSFRADEVVSIMNLLEEVKKVIV